MISVTAKDIREELQESLNGLIRIARSKEEQDRARLGASVAELVQLKLDPAEQEIATDILLNIMQQVERDIQEALSERLSIMATAPQRLIQTLANGDISVARPVLMKSCLLEDEDLIHIIKSNGQDYWESIAMRESMGNNVINTLVMTADNRTVEAMLSNDNIRLTDFAISKTVEMAKQNRKIADALSLREEIGSTIAAELYWLVSVELREQIVQNYEIDSGVVDTMLEGILQEYLDGMMCRYTITEDMLELAGRLGNKKGVSLPIMLKVLRRGQVAFFIALFAQAIDLSVDIVEKMVRQSSGQGMAIACRSLGIDRTEWVTIYLLTQPYRTQERLVDQADLQMATRYYDKVSQEIAQKIVDNSRHSLNGLSMLENES